MIVGALVVVLVGVALLVAGMLRRRSLRDEVDQFDAGQEALGRVVRRTASRRAPLTH